MAMPNKISSEEAFLLFEKWKGDESLLTISMIRGENRMIFLGVILDTLRRSEKLLLEIRESEEEGKGEIFLDLEGADFEFADVRESPVPALAALTWEDFLSVLLANGERIFIGVRRSGK
jgi:hypothetical protein